MKSRFHIVKLNPVTRKRLRRFRAHRRAHISLWLLVLLFVVSLGAELVCNDRPLYMRFNGKSYFPAFQFYPDDLFTASGQQTRPNYRALSNDDAFRNSAGNFMIFAPVRYSPLESISPDALRDQIWMEVRLSPLRHVGFVEIDSNFRIVGRRAAEHFVGPRPTTTEGPILPELWSLPPPFRDAVAQRFRNESAPRYELEQVGGTQKQTRATLTLSPFTSRAGKPETVRITLREVLDRDVTQIWRLDSDGHVVKGDAAAWEGMDIHIREEIDALWPIAFRDGRAEKAGVGPQKDLHVRFLKNEIAWPYPPCRGHWMGIDSAGRDVFARVLYGLRISLRFGLILVCVSMLIGILIGALQGYYGGKVDIATQRLIEIWSALPFLYVMILVGSVYGRSFVLLLFCYALFNWIGISYYIRAEFLRLRHLPFVEGARCMGIRTPGIILRHILPNALTPIITFFPFSLVGAIGSLAALDYLGFGLPPPTPSWGELLHQAQQYRWAWWLILFPSLALFVVMLLGVFIGEGVREAYDPKMRSKLS